jgi:sugar phosphate isomerase/epimerase
VDFQLDVYWAVTAGELPEKWIKKYPNRFVSCHIKDRKKGKDSHDISCILGTGNIRFSKFYKTAKHQGMKYYLVEQEDYEEGNSMFCAAANAKFMKKRKF